MTAAVAARIGPNAVHQLLPVLEQGLGAGAADRALERAGVARPPPDAGMLPEAECAALHRAVRQNWPAEAPGLLHAAGLATGDYILANRIPAAARGLIGALPSALGARLLTAAISRHAWTFAGSGAFRVLGRAPLEFEIRANPLVAGEISAMPACHWHRAVFARLFGRLVWPDVTVTETACCACGAPACRFTLLPGV